METIYMCNCGCGIHIFKNAGLLYFTSKLIEQEMITGVDRLGFINGKYSAFDEAIQLVRQEIELSPSYS